MRNGPAWRTLAKIAWRDLIADPLPVLFLIVTVAIGSGAIIGVRATCDAFLEGITHEPKRWLAADLSVKTKEPPTPEQSHALLELRRQGIDWTLCTETVAMASFESTPDGVLAAVKAVDTGRYPFYGELRTRPAGPLRTSLDAQSAFVSNDILNPSHAAAGERISLNGREFRIAGVIDSEPDRYSGSPSFLLVRVLLSEEGFARTGLSRAGNSLTYRYLFRLPSDDALKQARMRLEAIFPGDDIVDYRSANPIVVRSIEVIAATLGLMGSVSLLLGASGIAASLRTHMEKRLDTAAILKALGAKSKDIRFLFVFQIVLISLTGGILGLALARLEQAALTAVGSRMAPLEGSFSWGWQLIAQGIAAGMFATAIAAIPPLLSIGRSTHSALLRRGVEEALPYPLALPVLGLLSCAALAWFVTGLWQAALLFPLAVLSVIAATRAFATLAAKAARRVRNASLFRRSPAIRHGLANLQRGLLRSQGLLLLLTVGVAMLLTIHLARRGAAGELVDSLPVPEADLLVVGVSEAQREELLRLVSMLPSIRKPVEMEAVAWLQLKRVNDTSLDVWERRFGANHIQRMWFASRSSEVASDTVALSQAVATSLHVREGDRLEYAANGRTLRVRIGSVRRVAAMRSIWYGLTFSSGAFEGLPVSYQAGVVVDGGKRAEVRQALASRFPAAVIVSKEQLRPLFQGAADESLGLLRLAAMLALSSGGLVLIATVASEAVLRRRELAVFRLVGGTRKTLLAMTCTEFGLLGAIAAVVGSVLGSVAASVGLSAIFSRVVWAFDPIAMGIAIGSGAALAAITGCMASWRALRKLPMQALRGE